MTRQGVVPLRNPTGSELLPSGSDPSKRLGRILILFLVLLGWRSSQACGGPPVYRLHRSEGEQRIRDALESPTPDNFEFVEQPLSAAVEFIEDYFKINVELHDQAISESGVTPDTPFSRSLPNMPLRSALALILRELDLDFVITHDVLLITTEAAIDRFTEFRVYPVSDLTSDQRTSKTLACAIKTAFPHRAGGGPLTIVPYGDLLVIRDIQAVHDEIEALLTAMRLASAGSDVPAPRQPDPPSQSSGEQPTEEPSPASLSDDPFEAQSQAAGREAE